MRYGITRLVLGCIHFIELVSTEYEALKRAKECVVSSLDIEEKLNLLLENYAEFELELQELTTRDFLVQDRDWADFKNDLQTINRRIVNLLSACRLYIDQVKHDVARIYGPDSKEMHQLDAGFKEQYDAHQAYRVLEALRNYVQHRSLPVHDLGYHMTVEGEKARGVVRHTCVPKMRVKKLEEDGKFKSQVLKELAQRGESIDLRPLIREYVSCLWRVHRGLRDRMCKDVQSWDSQVDSIVKRFRDAFGKNVAGLALVIEDGGNNRRGSSYIGGEFSKRRASLERRNSCPRELERHYISGEVENSK